MRKQNAEFKTAFTSEAERKIKNTDSFGYVELDNYACYVIADGIDDEIDSMSAKLAVDTIISVFSEAPSISKKVFSKCLKAANKALIKANSKMKLKASVVMVVTDYNKVRYGQAGNSRFRLYRDGFLKETSKDHSLGMEMVQKETITPDKLAKHRQRNNLYCYLGQKSGFNPFISKKFSLLNSDVIALCTRGLWENVDDGELLDAFSDADDDPENLVADVEELLLSKQPKNLEKYTFAVIFINNIYVDSGKSKKIKKILMAAIPIAIIIVTMSLVLWIRYRNKVESIETMNMKFSDTIEYIQDDNYIRAEEVCKEAQELAIKVKDKKMQLEISNYLKLIETVIDGDDKLSEEKYSDAKRSYLNARERARYADNIGMEYIEYKLDLSGDYITIYDLISLGDTLVQNLQYKKAEEKYLEAKSISDQIYFDQGREEALEALERLYVSQKELVEAEEEAIQKQIESRLYAKEILVQGDKAYNEGDYESAKLYYVTAIDEYNKMEETYEVSAIQVKLDSAISKLEALERSREDAENYMDKATSSYEAKEYMDAKKYYLFAKDIYARLDEDEQVEAINRKIEIIDLDIVKEADKDAEKEVDKETDQEEVESNNENF